MNTAIGIQQTPPSSSSANVNDVKYLGRIARDRHIVTFPFNVSISASVKSTARVSSSSSRKDHSPSDPRHVALAERFSSPPSFASACLFKPSSLRPTPIGPFTSMHPLNMPSVLLPSYVVDSSKRLSHASHSSPLCIDLDNHSLVSPSLLPLVIFFALPAAVFIPFHLYTPRSFAFMLYKGMNSSRLT
ncbi:hypothetical protein BDN70DRAFT_934776 [Pholiota conissans]|uniref:Uncharacterized protein n=1 Tax=Pholiota conissans TaxID=109636 RepID=A0A9P5YWH8_9AGAR|nr:hypothetical protein BDN70DRAFT_934776 [Pholiota conissans]